MTPCISTQQINPNAWETKLFVSLVWTSNILEDHNYKDGVGNKVYLIQTSLTIKNLRCRPILLVECK